MAKHNFSDYEKQMIHFFKMNRIFCSVIKEASYLKYVQMRSLLETRMIQYIHSKNGYVQPATFSFHGDFTTFFFTDPLREKYKNAIIEVELFKLDRNPKTETITIKCMGLDATSQYFITEIGSKINVSRVIKVNGEPFNLYNFCVERQRVNSEHSYALNKILLVKPIDEILKLWGDGKFNELFNFS